MLGPGSSAENNETEMNAPPSQANRPTDRHTGGVRDRFNRGAFCFCFPFYSKALGPACQNIPGQVCSMVLPVRSLKATTAILGGEVTNTPLVNPVSLF